MSKIDELLESVRLREEDYKIFAEEPLSTEEFKEISEKVFAAVREEKKSEKETEVISMEGRRKRKTKKWILPLVATLVLGSSLIAGVSDGNIGELFKVIFKDNAANIGESGQVLGVSDKQQGITLNVQGIVGDKQSAVILFELEKQGNEAFEGNDIRFGRLDFEVKESSLFKGWNPFKLYSENKSSSSYGWSLINEESQTSGKRTLKLEASLNEELIGKKAVLKIKDIIEVKQGYWESETDLKTFFEQYPEYMSQETLAIPDEFRTYHSIEELKHEGYSEDEAKEIMGNIPERILPSKQLALDLYPETENSWKVDNIGFIDSKLHIRMYGTGNSNYIPGFKDSLGNQIETTYNITMSSSSQDGGSQKQAYYVYDIKDLDALSGLKLSTWFQKDIKTTEGEWQAEFMIDIKNQEKHIEINESLSWGENSSLSIEEMKISNISLQVTYSGDSLNRVPKAVLRFKDGTEEEIWQQSTSFEGKKIKSVYSFKMPVNISELKSILINEIEIPVK